MQHRRPGAHLAGEQAPDVGVGADACDDLLLLCQHRQGPHLIPEGCRLFKGQGLGGLVHLALQLSPELGQLALKEAGPPGDAPGVLLRPRPLGEAPAVAFADVVVEAGPLPANVPGEAAGAGGQLQKVAHRVNGGVGLVPPAEGAVVGGTVLPRLAHQRKPGIGLVFVQPHKGIPLVVL